jgi:uncharacterized protein YjbJ (UPF0337 family)
VSNGDKFQGKAKEVGGKLTGDEELEDEGERQHAKGEFQEKVDDAKETARGAFESAKDAVSGDDD